MLSQEIVVVEDDPDILYVFVEALKDGGLRPIAFHDAAEALEHIVRHPPALIITDIVMPGMGGEQFVRRVREACDPRIPILVTSASSKTPAVGSLPIQGFIGKPFDIGELLATVWRCVDHIDHLAPASPTAAVLVSSVARRDVQESLVADRRVRGSMPSSQEDFSQS